MQCSPLRIQVVKLGRGDASRAVKHSRKRGTVGVFQLLPLHRDRQVQTRSRAEFHPDADDVSSWRALSPLTTRRCNKGLAEAKPLFYLVGCRNRINDPNPFGVRLRVLRSFQHAPKCAPNFREHFGSIARPTSTLQWKERSSRQHLTAGCYCSLLDDAGRAGSGLRLCSDAFYTSHLAALRPNGLQHLSRAISPGGRRTAVSDAASPRRTARASSARGARHRYAQGHRRA